MSTGYVPRPTDIYWAKSMMAMIKDNGILAYPATKVIYTVDHRNKTLTLRNPEQLLEFPSFVIHQQTQAVFQEIGYTVEP
jgi:hypothetical protein